jgi:hypothetical protein
VLPIHICELLREMRNSVKKKLVSHLQLVNLNEKLFFNTILFLFPLSPSTMFIAQTLIIKKPIFFIPCCGCIYLSTQTQQGIKKIGFLIMRV